MQVVQVLYPKLVVNANCLTICINTVLVATTHCYDELHQVQLLVVAMKKKHATACMTFFFVVGYGSVVATDSKCP